MFARASGVGARPFARARIAYARGARDAQRRNNNLRARAQTPPGDAWRDELIDFWREYAGASARDVAALVDVADKVEPMRSAVSIAVAGNTLRRLLPDIDVCAVFAREPAMLDIELASAHKRVLELQDVLCDIDQCADVTALIERHPKLLLVEDIHAHVERAVEKLAALDPRCDARAVVREFPELIYRIHAYDHVESLPISIQNMLLDTSGEDEARMDEYDRLWDERERLDRGVDDVEATEWMLDGYYDADDL